MKSITEKNYHTYFISFYSQPADQPNTFKELFKLLNDIKTKHNQVSIIIAGDFNKPDW